MNSRRQSDYKRWKAMIYRCTNPTCSDWEYYGGRGITVCQRWMESFDDFIEDLPPRNADHLSIGRIDNNRGYEPGNVRWETAAEQGRNKRSNRWIEHGGHRMIASDWARFLGVSVSTILTRLDAGHSIQYALFEPRQGTTPIGQKRRQIYTVKAVRADGSMVRRRKRVPYVSPLRTGKAGCK